MQLPAPRAVSIGLSAFLILLFATLFFASKSPYLGFTTAPGKVGVAVVSISPLGSAIKVLQVGDEILAIASAAKSITLKPSDGMDEPDNTSSYAQYREFFKRQSLIWDIIQADQAHLDILRDKEVFRAHIKPNQARGLKHFGALFWYQITCASLIMLMGVAAWAFTNREIGPRLYALAGSSMALAIMSSAVYTTRELSIASDTFLLLARVNQVGMTFFAAFGTAMMWYYPTRLGRLPVAIVLPLIAALILGVNFSHLIDNTNLSIRTPFVLWLLLNGVLSYLQWQRTEGEPAQRARLKWLIYAWFIGLFGYISLVVAPQLLGATSIIQQSYAWGFFVITYFCVLLGVVRYKLFDLDHWVTHAWFWFFLGIGFIALDLALVLWLHIEPSVGLFISLALIGSIYLPLRQWLIHRLTPDFKQSANSFLPQIIEHLFRQSITGSLKQSFKHALKDSFQPLHIRRVKAVLKASGIADGGLKLQIPTLDQAFYFELSHASLGKRLFNLRDVATANSIYQLFSGAQRYRRAHAEGIHAERERLAADLHDDIGSRILDIIYTSQEPATLATARDTLRALRVAMQDLQDGKAQILKVIESWRREHFDRCQLAKLDLIFNIDSSLSMTVISATQRSQLTRIVRELISNAIHHSQASSITLKIFAEKNHLYMCYADDGIGLSALNERMSYTKWASSLCANVLRL